MLKQLIKYYATRRLSIKRFPKIRWLSLTYTLTPDTIRKDDGIFIRLATNDDIEFLTNHANAGENIIQSTLKFWRAHGFRSLYLGFFDGEDTPTVFQYVLYAKDNHIYDSMDYGGMYQKHPQDSVQVENIYMFLHKRKKMAALRFEHHLFSLLYAEGIRRVRTHIRIDNRAALIWARQVGFLPDKWITMVLFNLPGLRWLPKQFAQTLLQSEERDSFPLTLFHSREEARLQSANNK